MQVSADDFQRAGTGKTKAPVVSPAPEPGEGGVIVDCDPTDASPDVPSGYPVVLIDPDPRSSATAWPPRP